MAISTHHPPPLLRRGSHTLATLGGPTTPPHLAQPGSAARQGPMCPG